MNILRYILAITRGVILLLTMLVYLIIYAVSRIILKHTKSSGLKLRRAWITQMAYPILGLKVTVNGMPHHQPALYVGNHRSFVDPIFMSKYLDAFVIAKAEVADYPLISKGAEVTGVIYVKRENRDSRTNARQAFVDVVTEGHNILVYPEGTISTTKETLPFKKGTFIGAVKNDIPVIPIALEYKSKKDLWTIPNIVHQYVKQFGKWRTEAKMTFGPPMSAEDGIILAEKCEKWINGEIARMRENWSEIGN